MSTANRNTFSAKIKRTFTSVLPISKNRVGKCANCGTCCKLPKMCPLLKFKPNGESYCSIYKIRPLNCRKYPRTKSESVVEDICKYRFE